MSYVFALVPLCSFVSLCIQVVDRKGIKVNFQHNLIEVRSDQKEAVFALLADGVKGETTTVPV